jgi:hypothetical protein
MSRDWTQEELQATSKAKKSAGHLGYEEFCEQLNKTIFTAYCKDADNNLVKISGPYNPQRRIRKAIAGAFQPLKSNHSVVRGRCSFYKGKSLKAITNK